MTPTRMLANAKALPGTDDEVMAVQAILRDRSVTPLFQPIVDLSTGAVVGMVTGASSAARRPVRLADRTIAVEGG